MIGTRIGFYEITKQLGQGGMGAVYIAEHTRIGYRKVVKVLLPEYAQNEIIVRRFENEARAAAQLHHRNITKLDDFGQLPSGHWYIMMPLLEGCSLEAFLAANGRLSIHQALHILAQICAALHAAHGAGIVHRDLKPANVFLSQTEDNPRHVTLLDFGIAKVASAPEAMATHTGAAFGTPVYMAAEQFEDASRADARSDVFALGVIAYQMVTGEFPFGIHAGPVLYNKQMTTRPEPPQHVPPGWSETLLRALSPRPAERPESAHAFAVALAGATPEDPPFEPSGAEILAAVARELVTFAPANAETVRNNSGTDRALVRGPSMPPLATPAPAPLAPAPAVLAPSEKATQLARPSGDAAPAHVITTFSAMSGARLSTAVVQRARAASWYAKGLGATSAVALAAVAVFALGSGSRGAAPNEEPHAASGAAPTAAPAAPAPAPAAPAPTPALPVAPGPAPVAQLAEPVAVTFSTVPPRAVLTIDGKPAGIAPLTLSFAKDTTLLVRASKPGYAPLVRTLRVGSETPSVTLKLRPMVQAPVSPSPRPGDANFDPNAPAGGT